MNKDQITKVVQKTLKDLHSSVSYLKVDVPEDSQFGDYTSNVALVLAQQTKQNPRELAEQIKNRIGSADWLEKVEVAGSGFLNFYLSRQALSASLLKILSDQSLGTTSTLNNKKYLVEFAHPNTHKEFHIGHLRNIVTGEAICRILESAGARVIRANYQGDVGLHIAKAIWGIKKRGLTESENLLERIKFLGQAYIEGHQAYEEGGAKLEIDQINKKIYDKSDSAINEIYQKTRSWSLEYFQSIYDRLGIKFDRLYFESEVAELGQQLTQDALQKGIFQKSQGAVIYPGSQLGLHDRVFITQKDMPTYEAKDLGLAHLQFKEYQPDIIFHVVGPEQSDYLQVLFSALAKIMPESKDRERHIAYGWVRLKEGKMSSRQGNVVSGVWLLDKIKAKITNRYNLDSETAEQLTMGAVKYSFLKVNLASDIAFDIDESITIDGNSGPYLQYTVARIYGLFRKAGLCEDKIKSSKLATEVYQDVELAILRHLIHYPEIVEEAVQRLTPNRLTGYLFRLAEIFNSYYNSVRIIDDEKSKLSRLALSLAVARVLKSGLSLLGIPTPEKL